MAIFDLFSKRQKRLRGDIPDIYVYYIPQPLKVQIIHIIRDAIGISNSGSNPKEAYKFIHNAICREYGFFQLGPDKTYHETDEQQLLNFLLQTEKTEEAIDLIEFSFQYIDKIIRSNNGYRFDAAVKMNPDSAILELNERFKESGVGYSFDGGEIIRIDSTYTHSEIAKPTISLLSNRKFSGANEEYLKAHEHYRHGRNKECLTECLKAFESTMKIICKEKSWAFNPTDTARKLIQICFTKELVPSFTQNQFTSLQNSLESGIPTIRNKLGGHGQGAVPQKVDDGMTRYILNLTGSNIIFLIEQSGIK